MFTSIIIDRIRLSSMKMLHFDAASIINGAVDRESISARMSLLGS